MKKRDKIIIAIVILIILLFLYYKNKPAKSINITNFNPAIMHPAAL